MTVKSSKDAHFCLKVKQEKSPAILTAISVIIFFKSESLEACCYYGQHSHCLCLKKNILKPQDFISKHLWNMYQYYDSVSWRHYCMCISESAVNWRGRNLRESYNSFCFRLVSGLTNANTSGIFLHLTSLENGLLCYFKFIFKMKWSLLPTRKINAWCWL